MEHLLGSLVLTAVSQNEPKTSPCGVKMLQLNATLMSVLEGVEWFVFLTQVFVLVQTDSKWNGQTGDGSSTKKGARWEIKVREA